MAIDLTAIQDALGKQLEADLKRTVPVRTGLLKSSVDYIGRGRIHSVYYGQFHIPQIAERFIRSRKYQELIRDEIERQGVFTNGE